MKIDEGTFAQRFGKRFALYAGLFIPVFLLVWGGWKFGGWVADTTGYGWLEVPIGIAFVIVVFSAVSTAMDRD